MMENDKRSYVTPGDVITTGTYRADQNVICQNNKIISTVVGISEIYDNNVKVIPLAGIYMPKVNDIIIGKVISHTSLSWELDINSCYSGFLPAHDVFGRDFSAHADQLSSKLAIGDVVTAKIANFDKNRDPLITIADKELGKINSGELVEISPSKVPRLIGKRGTMIQTIESITHASIIIGQNGRLIVSCKSPNLLSKTISAIKMIETQSHVADLTDKVKSKLESEGD